MSINATTRLASDLATSVKRQFGDESGTQITDTDIIRWINDGQREINQQNKVIKATATTTATENVGDYTLPVDDAAVIESIHYNGIPLLSLPYQEVEKYVQAYDTQNNASGIPSIWYSWGGTITFYPKPGSSTDVIKVLYTKNPPQITSLSDTLGLPDRYYNALVQYVLSQAYELDEDWDASNYKSQQVEKTLGELADAERTTENLTYPTISVVGDF